MQDLDRAAVEVVQVRLDYETLESVFDFRRADDYRVQNLSILGFEKAAGWLHFKSCQDGLGVEVHRHGRTAKAEETRNCFIIPPGVVDQPDCHYAMDAAANPPDGLYIPLQPKRVFPEFV